MKKLHALIGAGALAGLVLGSAWLFLRGRPGAVAVGRKPDALRTLQAPLPTSGKDLISLVEKNRSNPDKIVQDRVGEARIRLGYLAAEKKDWPAARATFQIAVHEYKGAGMMASDFGGVPDQAAYQAIVCLVPEGKTEQAEREFIKFMKDWPMSPLTHAAFKRLVRLNGGKPKPEWEALLQRDQTMEEDRARLDISACGPMSIQHLLGLLGKPPKGYQEIAKLCGTKVTGTTISGMCQGLKSLGIDSYAYNLNRQDLAHAPLPAIILWGEHYVTATKVEGDLLTTFDTQGGKELTIELPVIDDPDYSISAILLRPLEAR